MSLKNWVFSTFFAISAVLALPLHAQTLGVARSVTVIGSGQISAPPDKAVITLGARHAAKSAADALAQTSVAVAAILSRMEEMGVEKRDMQTSSLNLNPVWRQGQRYDDEGMTLAPIGFEASNTVTVTLLDLDSLGAVLDSVARDGANSFSGFRFGLIDPQPVQDRARETAVQDARRKAELYARAAGVSLGDVVLITEELGGGTSIQAPMMEMSAARSGAVPIAQGEVSQSARVKIIFQLTD
jgi:uncharacterized protein YggE